ncbi:phage tail protein [Bacillus horti]|uniref:Microcystin-dependent protein n=1 Tax=Caldalkalibacillus horti TaxID=77523 RepID=A0ABT9VVX4_9BACI|nr:tail fiber protein [Bacillus horti]MDQ0165035.1 microcystin-dependent protein [Bacillus horti]
MDQYIGEIRMFGGSFAPSGWAFCNGQLLQIAENELLYTLLGTTYGGNGQTNFGLPDLRGRVPIHQGSATTGTSYSLGQLGGSETVQLSVNQLPSHTHIVNATSDTGTEANPSGNVWANNVLQYSKSEVSGTMFQGALSSVGGNQPHNNIMPFTAIHFIIALEGIFPQQG